MTVWRKTRTILIASAVGVFLIPSASGQHAQTKRKVERGSAARRETQDKVIRVKAADAGKTPARVRYLPTSPRFRHIRVVERALHNDRLPETRTVIVRSTAIRPRALVRFEDRRQEQIRSVIRLYRDGSRTQAVRTWGGFVAGLGDYHEPVDLDEIMLYVARECCFHEDDAALFHAQKLGFLHDSGERLDDYIEQLENRRAALRHRGGGFDVETLEDIESELARARAEREIVHIRARLADQTFGAGAYGSRDNEQRFGSILTDLYREAGQRVRFTATTTHICTRECHEHYYDHDAGKLVILKGHRHGPGCGHRWDGKYWISDRKKKVRRP